MTRPPESSRIATGNGDLWWETSGDGPPLILIHSALADSRSWDRLVNLLDGKFQLIRYDARGHGRSAAARGAYGLLADCLDVMASAGVDRACFVGNSVGADVALAAALQCPGRVSSLVLLGAGVDVPAADHGRQLRLQWHAARAAGDVELAVELARALWITADDQLERARAVFADEASYAALRLGELPEFDLEDIGRITSPTLVVVGEDDDELMRASAQCLASTIPGASLMVVKHAGHLPHEDQPTVVADAISKLVGRNSPRADSAQH